MHELDAALGVGDRPLLLEEGAAGQHHVRILRRLGEDDILHHQEVELLQRLDHVVLVGIGHHGVFPEHVERLHVAGDGAVERLHDGEAGLHRQVKGDLPGLHEFLLIIFARDGLIGRVDGIERAHVAGALHIALTPQRVHAAARDADITQHHLQVRDALHAVDARLELRDAHAVVRRHGRGLREDPRGLYDVVGVLEAADAGDVLGRILLERFRDIVEALAAIGDVVLVLKIFLQNHVHQAVQDGDIGPRKDLEEHICVFRQIDAPRIDDHQFFTLVDDLVLDHGRDDRMVVGRVRADDQKGLGKGYLTYRIRHGTRTERGRQTGDRGAVS